MRQSLKHPLSILPVVCLTLVVSGCDDEDEAAKLKAAAPKVKIAANLHEFKVPLPPKVEEAPLVEPEPVIEDIDGSTLSYPDPRPILRADKARAGRIQRQMALISRTGKSKNTIDLPDLEEEYRLEDPDYQQWDPKFAQDKSTYPVKRNRILTADKYISAILENSINSQLGGRVIAVVDSHVFSPDGWNILLPKQTRIICNYESLAKVGESRLNVQCTRAIRPDGVSIALTEAHGADQMGRTGLIGQVDNRVWARYGSAFVVASLSALSSASSSASNRPVVNAAANALSTNLGQVTAKVLDQYLDLAPVMTISAGSKIHIIPQNDIVLREPVSHKEAQAAQQAHEDQPITAQEE